MPAIAIYNKCNNKCLMCTNPEDYCKESKEFELSNILTKIESFSHGNNEFLENFRDAFVITGGEPTLAAHTPVIINKIDRESAILNKT